VKQDRTPKRQIAYWLFIQRDEWSEVEQLQRR